MKLQTLTLVLLALTQLLSVCGRVHADDKQTMDELIAQGKQFRSKDELPAAIVALNEALRREPDHAHALRLRSQARLETNELDGAMQDANRAVELASDVAEGYLFRAKVRIWKDQDFTGAISDYDKAAKMAPKDWVILNNRGFAKKQLKRYEDAAKDFETAIELAPKNADLHQFLGECKYNLGEYETALKEYELGLELAENPTNRQWYTTAEACYQLRKYREAIKYVTHAIGAKNLPPDQGDDWCYNMIGHCHFALGEFQSALTNYDKAAEVRPAEGSYQHCRGLALNALGKKKEAEEAFAKASELGHKPE